MIAGHLSTPSPFPLPKIIEKGLTFLRQTNFEVLSAGKVPIDGDRIFAEIIDRMTYHKDTAKPEAHAKYLDIHYCVSGIEYIGVAPDLGNNTLFKSLMPKQDILFYEAAEHEVFIKQIPGSYLIVFPTDIHRPCCCMNNPMKIRKVVIKIAMDHLNQI
ncbi:YhcH/YjgK/YiaL family protein [Commensalibacter oyaizuii]|uniref:YhcH/YjgK/YiaL family protein n=1 Tax=Commensalibacter oyaizuii TaxID=3043873 RepID=A0ABT6Q3X0_9PROT|nr:YhcH/YjgK/YiaL family protein [Commensalibacter sp. TBRC 16381]MDI2091797.1 YhcH/YjgK/YiaL family protein [Commensalibacter sp. TBRC 16381]